MKDFDTRSYSVADFSEWESNNQLVLSPEFQRRAVWKTKAKSYLIDTILRGKPMPKVFITQKLIDGRTIRTVVDGQQRLRAILEFLGDNFTVLRTHNQEFAGKNYSSLPEHVQRDFLQYEIGVDVLYNTELKELLDIFSRLNTYSVRLNQTELLNATYLGSFKTAVHEIGHKYAQYLLDARILTDSKIARMGEVELAADLLGALITGISAKKSIPNFYKKFDDADDIVSSAMSKFNDTMSFFTQVFTPQDLSASNFHRIHLFYSAFVSISNMLTGTPKIPNLPSRIPYLPPSRIRVILDDISAQFDEYTDKKKNSSSVPSIPHDYEIFIQGSRRATTDQSVREERSRFISSFFLKER